MTMLHIQSLVITRLPLEDGRDIEIQKSIMPDADHGSFIHAL